MGLRSDNDGAGQNAYQFVKDFDRYFQHGQESMRKRILATIVAQLPDTPGRRILEASIAAIPLEKP